MNPETDLRQTIREEALRLGFSHCGFSPVRPLEELRERYTALIRRGDHEPFTYLATHLENRLNPALLLPGARTVIALLMNYFPPKTAPGEEQLIIARYGLGPDYHRVMKERLRLLCNHLSTLSPESSSRAFVDSGPVLEKAWAQQCGVGWQGKNTLLIHPAEGSFFFIGIVLTTMETEADAPEVDHCGGCNRCVEACPTGALDTPYRLDIRRCIAYHTIENSGEIPEEIRRNTGNRIYGCDTCQNVCPYNRHARATDSSPFIPNPELLSMTKAAWQELTPEGFRHLFAGTAVHRRGYEMFKRNIGVAIANDYPPQR